MSHNASLLIAGTMAIDTIITPSATAHAVLGGSAAYAAAAAALLTDHIDTLSIIGDNFPVEYERQLENHGIHLNHVTRSPGPSFEWTGEYFANMNQRRTLHANDHVMLDWHVCVPQELAHHDIIVASCMVPMRQLELIRQCRSPKLIMSDSMDKWIGRQPELLDEVISHSHIAFMNEEEAKAYAHTDDLMQAASRILSHGPTHTVIKQGSHGSTLFSQSPEGSVIASRFPAYPITRFVDPTGAGDSFMGTIAGYLATHTLTPTHADMQEAVIHATVAASFTCESFSATALFTMNQACYSNRLEEFRAMI